MSGSLGALGSASNPGNYLQLVQALMQQPQGQQAPNSPVPLASMVDRLSPNAVGLQQQNAQLPWYAVPGMFRNPAPPNAALAATAAGAAPQQSQGFPPWLMPTADGGGSAG